MSITVKGPLIQAVDNNGKSIAFRADAIIMLVPATDPSGTPLIGHVGVLLQGNVPLAIKGSVDEVASAVHVAQQRARIGADLVRDENNPGKWN